MKNTKAPRPPLVLISSDKRKQKSEMKKARKNRDVFRQEKKKSRIRRMPRIEKIKILGLMFLLFLAAAIGMETAAIKREVPIHGVIAEINLDAHTLSISSSRGSSSELIHWKEGTEFKMNGEANDPSALKPSMHLTVWKRMSLFFPDKVTRVRVDSVGK